MELLSIKPTISRPSLSSLWSLHVHLQSEAHDVDLRSISQASLPTPLFSNPTSTTLLRNVKSLSDLNQTYRLDLSVANIQDENSYITQLARHDQVTAKQRNRCVFEWLEGIEKKTFFLPTI
ncbi:KH domain-containing protein [Dirofilaria immitis]